MPDDLREFTIGDGGGAKRIRGWIFWIVLVLATGGVFVWLFLQFTGSWRVAVAVVAFMLGYMALMAWWASRNDATQDDLNRRGD